jgi:flavin reductase (DIM6/NTAB) family NADH-FMN oxidoreductase RutF
MPIMPDDSEPTQRLSPDQLRTILRRWSTGVTLVTVNDGEKSHGMTVNSFTSVSLAPPLILVSLERGTRTNRMVQETSSFAVAILEQGQRNLAERFAGRIADSDDRFRGVAVFSSSLGHPIPDGCLAYLDAHVRNAYEAGTHTLFIAETTHGATVRDGKPLLYYDRDYRHLIE